MRFGKNALQAVIICVGRAVAFVDCGAQRVDLRGLPIEGIHPGTYKGIKRRRATCVQPIRNQPDGVVGYVVLESRHGKSLRSALARTTLARPGNYPTNP